MTSNDRIWKARTDFTWPASMASVIASAGAEKRRSGGMSNPQIDEWYQLGMRNGAVGGKLVGAGGGGFLLFYAEDRNRLRQAMQQAGLEEVRFRFDYEGTKVLFS